MERESMQYDVVIVGGGPSGLACAIRLKQLAQAGGREISVCVLEKGSEIGAHILSGAVLEPRALAELFPDWKELGAPLNTPAAEDRFLFLTESKAWKLPTPPQMANHGNYIISLGNLCRWLAGRAEGLGVEIYPGFAAAEVLYDEKGRVRGVATGDMGIGKDGSKTEAFQPGHRAARASDGVRGGLSRLAHQDAVRALPAARRRRSADLRARDQGAVGGRAGEAPARPRHPYHRLAARQRGPTAGRSSITSRATRSRSVSSSGSTTKIRTSRRTRSSSASRRIPRSADSSTAGGGSLTARVRSTKAGSSRCRS